VIEFHFPNRNCDDAKQCDIVLELFTDRSVHPLLLFTGDKEFWSCRLQVHHRRRRRSGKRCLC